MRDYRREWFDAARLYNRSVELGQSVEHELDFQRAKCLDTYNALWEDVRRFVDDRADFERSVPRAGVGISLLGHLVYFPRYTVKELKDKLLILQGYLRDYIAFKYPDLAAQNFPQYQESRDRARKEQEIESLRARNRALEDSLHATTDRLSRLNEMLLALTTPSQFEIPEEALDKLDPLERTRLLEAVQAYRVNAWTPAAAVCGMILEGRLQKLCREHGIRPGGIGDMIRRLGEAGLLRGYYQNLAQVGEFFRHRASHPTSEEFDREKTTLVLTSLVILIRDLF